MRQKKDRNYYDIFFHSPNGAAIHEVIYDGKKKPVNYRLLDVNAAYEKILQLSREKVVGKLATEAYQTSEAPYLTEYLQATNLKEPMVMEVYFEPMHKYFKISCFFVQEKVFVTVFEDISDRKLSEQMLLIQKDLGIVLNCSQKVDTQ